MDYTLSSMAPQRRNKFERMLAFAFIQIGVFFQMDRAFAAKGSTTVVKLYLNGMAVAAAKRISDKRLMFETAMLMVSEPVSADMSAAIRMWLEAAAAVTGAAAAAAAVGTASLL